MTGRHDILPLLADEAVRGGVNPTSDIPRLFKLAVAEITALRARIAELERERSRIRRPKGGGRKLR